MYVDTLATTECQLSIALAPGNYVGTFTTLDAGGATYTSGLVSEYAPPYTGCPIVNVSAGDYYSAVTLGSDGTMYAANVSGEIDASAPPYHDNPNAMNTLRGPRRRG